MFIDSHCHLDFAAFDGDRDEVIARATDAGVEHFIVPGVTPERWGHLANHPHIDVGLGIHPYVLTEMPESVEDALDTLPTLIEEVKPVAIGECGLDRRYKTKVPLAWQIEIFERHVQIARDFDLPMIIHCVGAHGYILKMLERYAPIRGVIHSYTGSIELAKKYVQWGLKIGLSGFITYGKSDKVLRTISEMPLRDLMLETDSPDQPPLKNGEKALRGEPVDVIDVAKFLTIHRNESFEEIARQTTDNTRELFFR